MSVCVCVDVDVCVCVCLAVWLVWQQLIRFLLCQLIHHTSTRCEVYEPSLSRESPSQIESQSCKWFFN